MTKHADKANEDAGKGRVAHPFLRFVKRNLLTRFVCMMVIPALGLLVIWIHAIEPNRLMPRTERLSSQDLDRPPLKRSLRIIHVSDLLLDSEKSVIRFQKAVEEILKLHPDLVMLTGNIGLPQRRQDLETAASCFAYLRSIVPTFACLGPRDYETPKTSGATQKPKGRLLAMLLSSGIHVLQNERKDLIVNGARLSVVGLADHGRPEDMTACLESLDDQDEEAPLTLVLSHKIPSSESLQGHRWNLLFGGTQPGSGFRMPFTRWCPFARGDTSQYAAKGLYALPEHRFLSVTSGVGNYHEMRLNCFPEVVLIEVTP